MAKRVKHKRKLTPRVKKVVLAPTDVVRVVVPPGTKPVVVADEEVVEIAAVKTDVPWWKSFFR